MFLGSILPAQARNIPEKKQILPGSSIIYNSLAPKHEVRAVWLTTIGGIDWPHSYSQSPYSAKKQQQELCQILDRLQQAKINTVLIQTRIRGTMIYPSDYEPWDGCLSGFRESRQATMPYSLPSTNVTNAVWSSMPGWLLSL